MLDMDHSAKNFYYELEPEDNHFPVIYVDITHRCNMACANCFLPNRTVPDMDMTEFFKFASRLPRGTELRLLGGEPTVREDLPNIIQTLKKLGQHPNLITNGLKLANKDYVQTLKQSGLRRVGISMNGGDDDLIYEKMDHKKCAKEKLLAVRNCAEAGMIFSMGAILQRGVNEFVPKKLVELARELKPIGYVRLCFRNIGYIGRYNTNRNQNFQFSELVDLISDQLQVSSQYIYSYQTAPHLLSFPLDAKNPKRSIWIKITDWAPNPMGSLPYGSKHRGRVTQSFKIAPAAEHFKIYENEY